MRSGQIQHVISTGVPPFALCRIVSRHIRTSHKRGDHIQDSIEAVFGSLRQQATEGNLGRLTPAQQREASDARVHHAEAYDLAANGQAS